jgi:hypothetical protein
MSMTWTNFRSAVLSAYNSGAQGAACEAAAIEAVANLVKSQIVREVDSDLPLAKSYRDAYLAAKVRLAGYTITSNFATVKAAVIIRITVDGARSGISSVGGYNDLQIQQAMDDFNGTVTMFDQLLVMAAIEIQRHVPCYKSNQESTYTLASSEIRNDGFVTKLTLPDQSILRGLWFGLTYDALVANTAYAVDDYVASNGRVYQCVVAGTSANPLGDGLVSIDGLPEVSGTAEFNYIRPLDFMRMAPVSWADRQYLFQDQSSVDLLYVIAPPGTEAWIYPAMRDEHALKLEWDGLKTVFAGADSTPFDAPAAQYAAEHIRSMLQKNVLEDNRAASASMAVAAAHLKRMYLDCFART